MQHGSHCQAKVWIKEGRYHKHGGEHNHFADPMDVAGRKVVEKGKNELRNNFLVSNSSWFCGIWDLYSSSALAFRDPSVTS